MEIRIRYQSVDGYSKTRTFKTMSGARKFAQEWVGKDAEVGRFYAVSSDGIGKITVSGCTLDDLFKKEA